MSRSHQRLSDIHALPARSASGAGALPADLKRLKAWLGELPWANPEVTLNQLADAALDLAGRTGVAAADRFGAAEAMRKPVGEVVAIAARRYTGIALPLPEAGVEAARLVESLHLGMATAYRRAAADWCAPSGSLPLLRSGKVVQALERAAFHYSQALAVSWVTYREPGGGGWQGLYRCHGFAADAGIAAKAAGDPSLPGVASVQAHLLSTLLVGLANPYAFDQDDQALLWQLARDYLPHLSLLALPGGDEPESGVAVVPADEDRGPGGQAAEGARGFGFQACMQDVEAAIQTHEGDPAANVHVGRGRVARELPLASVRQLRRAFGQRSARRHARLPASHALEIVVGLAGLHFHVSGRDFQDFVREAREHVIHIGDRAGWAQSGADAARAPVVRARVLDQSLGGYRIDVRDQTLARARVGEVVGLSWPQDPGDAGPERDWLVGVIRWLRYDDAGGVSAGIELLSRHPVPVAIQAAGDEADARQALRAVELHDGPTDDAGAGFLVSASDQAPKSVDVLEVHAEQPRRMDLRASQRAGEYLIFSPRSE